MSIIDKVRQDRENLAHVLKNHPGIRRIVEDLYPDRAHFIYELLQNAEDKNASEVSFVLSKEGLAFEHNGQTFEEKHIWAITDIGEGTSAADDDNIGRFGIGFKAVFAYTETPCIWSPKFAFEISDMVLPSELKLNPLLGERTRFEFPFNSPKKPTSEAFSEIRTGLEEISEDTLLFLSHIESIHWRVDDGMEVSLLRIPHSNHHNHIEILKESCGKATESSHFLRFTQPIKGLERQYAAIAFELNALPGHSQSNADNSLAKRFRIAPAKPGRVSVYFTAAKETSGLRFHLHAPFLPELSRASIKDAPANTPLFQQLAILTAQSLFKIRDFGLLNADFLAVLPNLNDDLPARYACIREAIVNAMNEQPLTPTYTRSHAPAKQLLQAPATLKSLLNEKDIEVLVDFEGNSPIWAIAATQKNSDIDRFLSDLYIADWGIEQFVKALEEGLSSRFRIAKDSKYLKGPDEKFIKWLQSKPNEWHQELYVLLYKEFKGPIHRLKDLCIVRLSPDEYMVGSKCYFPTKGIQKDSVLPRVAMGTYTSGRSISNQDGARKFLESIGVREVGEFEQVESILMQRYSKEAKVLGKRDYEKDLWHFVSLVEGNPTTATMFSDYFIFEREDGKWALPGQVYLDSPYFETGLHTFFEALNHGDDDARPVALADRYLKIGVPREALAAFAKAAGAHTKLTVEKQSTVSHPKAACLRQDYNQPRVRVQWTKTHIDTDWTIPDLKSVLEHPSVELSRLIWNTMIKEDKKILKAQFRPNQGYATRFEQSTLVLTLRALLWVPQRGGGFVRPVEASQDQLPEGFPFDPGWFWIKAVGFGEENDKRVEEGRRNLEIAKKLGFNDNEALEHGKRFAELDPDTRRRFLTSHEDSTDLPTHEPRDQGRRVKKVRQGAKNAPERATETSNRTGSQHREEVKEGAKPYLQEQYTKKDGIMICQACKDELPFKLAGGDYFFETVEFLPELRKHHYQNYLTLCPNHAAMYQHANGSKELMKEQFLGLNGNELEVVLANKEATVYFTQTHITDLRVVIESEDSNQAET